MSMDVQEKREGKTNWLIKKEKCLKNIFFEKRRRKQVRLR